MKNFDLTQMVIVAGAVLIAACIAGVVVLSNLSKWTEKTQLNAWRKTLSVGDKVKVSDGSVVFNGQIVSFPNGFVRVISSDMRLAAYPFESIYPQ